jgi:hypothetical protein
MSRQRMRQGSGPPSICWYCLKQLQRAPGKGRGLFYFEIVADRGGVEHRIHGGPCLRGAVDDGNKHIKQEAA